MDGYSIKDMYTMVRDQLGGFCQRLDAVSKLEELTNQDFKNTADFHDKMEKYLSSNMYTGVDLKSVRKLKGYSQQTLAWKLGVSKQFISQMEGDKMPLITKALRFIENNGMSDHSKADLVDKTPLKTKEL